MNTFLRTAVVFLSLAIVGAPLTATADPSLPELSYKRLLRRVTLTLLGRSPAMNEYQALLDAASDAEREGIIQSTIDDALVSPVFYEQLVQFGYEYMGVRGYGDSKFGNDSLWLAGQSIHLKACPPESKHAGKLGMLYAYYENYGPSYGDNPAICDDHDGTCQQDGSCRAGFQCDGVTNICAPVSCGNNNACGAGFECDQTDGACVAIVREVEPWWAPETTVTTIGYAGVGTKEIADLSDPGAVFDCGVGRLTQTTMYRQGNSEYEYKDRCSCGPNLIFCGRRICNSDPSSGEINGCERWHNEPGSQRRALFDESARLFAHIIVQDRPFTDLVLGDYTVVNQGLQHLYVRMARQTGAFEVLDEDIWWKGIDDPDAWREVVVETMNPYFLAARDTQFDPSKDYGEPQGIPSAGVLTTIGSLGSFARERPRAARWLENLTCRQFNPPPADVVFEPYERDPATEGVCKTCHMVIDPAAIHFKRFSTPGLHLAGFAPYRWSDLKYGNPGWHYKDRWEAQFIYDTVMTPVDEATIQANPDARFIDFAPPGTTLFGVESDGTIGPLGFAKMIVASGEFDRCTVRRFYQRYGGVMLDPAKHKLFIDTLLQVYLSNARQIRPLIKWIVTQPNFRLGR